MSDYLLGQLDDEVGLLTAENARLRADVDKLTRWKAEATTVIEQWDAMWEAIGRPGPLGATKAECVRAEVETLRDALVTDKRWEVALSASAERLKALQTIIDAWEDAGPVPNFHMRSKQQLLATWPTLGLAIAKAAKGRAT